jgi:protein required for attachment to host cells
MSRIRNLLIVLADGEHVRFVRPAPDNSLHSEGGLDSIAAHKRSAELGSGRPGAAFHSDSSAHHAFKPRHDPHDQEKEKFAHVIAQQLNDGTASGAFEELVVVAPPHVLNAIRGALDAATDARIVGTLSKDLVKTPDDELLPHIEAWVGTR